MSRPHLSATQLARVWVASLACGLLSCAQQVDEIQGKAEPGADRQLEPVADSWPWWRGPQRNAVAGVEHAPTSWSDSENVIWKVPVPGRGHATPIVWGSRVFVATADAEQQVISLLAYDQHDGRLLWNQPVQQGGLMHTHPKGSHASATPACDGQRVFTALIAEGQLWVTAVSVDGRILWHKQAGPFKSEHGFGASPVLFGSLVIVASDSPGASYLAGLDRETGQICWRRRRDGGISRRGGGSYGTPIVAHIAGRDQLLLSGRGQVVSYDPRTGSTLWTCQGPAETTANTVAWSGDFVFAGAGYPEIGLMCIRADGNGDVSDTHIVWHRRKVKAYVPTPLAIDDRVMVADDRGMAVCLDTHTGSEVFKHRLGGGFSASPVLAAGNVYVPNESGKMFVFKWDDQFQLVAENDLADGGFASPVFSQGKLFLRTLHSLYCIGQSRRDAG